MKDWKLSKKRKIYAYSHYSHYDYRKLHGDTPYVKVGDTVMYAKFAGTIVKYENEEFLVLNERDILLIVKQ